MGGSTAHNRKDAEADIGAGSSLADAAAAPGGTLKNSSRLPERWVSVSTSDEAAHSASLANPKSNTFTCDSGLIIMLAGLMAAALSRSPAPGPVASRSAAAV